MPEEFDPAWEYYVPDPEFADDPEPRKHSLLEVSLSGMRPVARKRRPKMIRAKRIEPLPVCLGCRQPFVKKKDQKEPKHCSWKCYLKAKIALRRQKCPTCKKHFYRKKSDQKYCSLKCIGKSKKKVRPRKCSGCRKWFTPKRTEGRYCSWTCASKHMNRFKFEYVTYCPVCGGEVPRERRDEKLYCREKCADLAYARKQRLARSKK